MAVEKLGQADNKSYTVDSTARIRHASLFILRKDERINIA